MAEEQSLGQRVAFFRGLRDLTQQKLGEQLGVSAQTISNWENGVSHVPSKLVPAVAEAFGVTVAELYGEQLASNGNRDRDSSARHRTERYQSGGESRRGEFFNGSPSDERLGVRPMPIFRWGSAGDPRDYESSPHPDREEYPPPGREHLIGPHGHGIDVRGDSMVGCDVHDGDVAWVNPDKPYRIGDLVAALVINGDGDSGTVIKIYAHTEVGDCLLSCTEAGRTPVVCSEFKIIGPVVGVSRWVVPSRR